MDGYLIGAAVALGYFLCQRVTRTLMLKEEEFLGNRIDKDTKMAFGIIAWFTCPLTFFMALWFTTRTAFNVANYHNKLKK